MSNFDLRKYLNAFEIDFTEEKISQLTFLMKDTLLTNEKFNLTAITNEDDFLEKMIFDSALSLYDLDLSDKKIIDIGTGAGFPGLVIKILQPNCNMYLLDSTKKKIDHILDFAFRTHMHVSGISSRAEMYAKNHREEFDFAIARAVSKLNILLEISIPLLKIGGTFLALKGADFEKEVNESKNALKKLGCHIEKIIEFNLPVCEEKRAIIYIVKDKKTDEKYPREYSEIKRHSL